MNDRVEKTRRAIVCYGNYVGYDTVRPDCFLISTKRFGPFSVWGEVKTCSKITKIFFRIGY